MALFHRPTVGCEETYKPISTCQKVDMVENMLRDQGTILGFLSSKKDHMATGDEEKGKQHYQDNKEEDV